MFAYVRLLKAPGQDTAITPERSELSHSGLDPFIC